MSNIINYTVGDKIYSGGMYSTYAGYKIFKQYNGILDSEGIRTESYLLRRLGYQIPPFESVAKIINGPLRSYQVTGSNYLPFDYHNCYKFRYEIPFIDLDYSKNSEGSFIGPEIYGGIYQIYQYTVSHTYEQVNCSFWLAALNEDGTVRYYATPGFSFRFNMSPFVGEPQEVNQYMVCARALHEFLSGQDIYLIPINNNGYAIIDQEQSSINEAVLACAVSIENKWCWGDALVAMTAGNYDRTIFNLSLTDVVLGESPGAEPQPDDPFSPGGTSEPGGGGGTFDDSSDSIPDSSLPTLSAANTGFTRIYNPTLEQVQAMANYLWTDETVIETIWNHIKQFLENPMEAFIGFNLVPCEVPDGGTQEFKVMYIGTGVNMTVAANQFVDVDCGTVTVEPYYGSALDYAPYTRISCFLPYIGQVDLDTDEVMGATLQIKYRIDIVTGSCVAKIFVDGNVVYQYSGHCAINIPFTSADFSNYVSAIISIAKLAVGAAAAGAAGALGAGASEAPTMQLTGQTIERYTSRNPATGRQITTGTFTRERYSMQGGDGGTQASFNALSPSNIANTVGQVMSSKPAIEHAGSFSGNSGYLGVRRPFLDITRPRMCNPSEYGKYNGYPAMLTLQLGNCTGFTQVQQIQLTGLTATNPEQAEILSLLKTGVIL